MTGQARQQIEQESVEAELVDALFRTLLPNAVMSALFVAIGGIVATTTGDAVMWGVVAGGTAVMACKMWLMAAYRARPARGAAPTGDWGRWFAILSLGVAGAIGTLGARSFAVGTSGAEILAAGLLFGYCSGLVAHTALRPRLAVACLSIATLPVVVAAALHDDFELRVLSVVLFTFLVASFQSVRQMHAMTMQHIDARRAMANLARIDPLTGLPNRLGLDEAFRAQAATGMGIAIHCFDLDGFKPVNDRHGHPVGDALLRTLAQRVGTVLRDRDTAARVGGDEFVVLQVGIRHESEAELFARRLTRAITAPYALDGNDVRVGVSLGFVVAGAGPRRLDALVAAADKALYHVKQNGGGVEAGVPALGWTA